MLFTLGAVPLAVGTVVLWAIYRYAIFPAFLSPLAKIPTAHWTCSISLLWIFWKRVSLCQNTTVYAAHLKHGPIVRLGPNELSVNCLEGGFKTIYAGPFEKDEYYSFFNKFGRLLPILERATLRPPSGGVDVYSLWQAYTMDTITAFYLGLKCGTNFLEDELLRERWRRQFLSRVPYAVYLHEMPNWTARLAKSGIRIVPRWYDDATRDLETLVTGWYHQTLDYLKVNPHTDPASPDDPLALSTILAGYESERGAEESRMEPDVLANPEPSILSELMDNIATGYETSGITMTCLTWHLSQDVKLQSALRQELLTLDQPMYYPKTQGPAATTVAADQQILPDPKALDALPLLHALLVETLRLHGAVPGAQPRIVPSSGGNIGPYKNIPGGVRVGSSVYVLHRNTDVFPDPEKWDPMRWLEDDAEAKKARGRWFFAFSGGPRMCAGRNFAFHGTDAHRIRNMSS